MTAIFFMIFMTSCLSGRTDAHRKDEICGVCGNPLGTVWVVSDGNFYHSDCFEKKVQLHCAVCGKSISGAYVKDSQGVYHEKCYQETRLERCVICGRPIEGEHLVDIWGQSSHKEHNGKKISLCDSCGRIISPGTLGGETYSDGRLICGICKKSSVTDVQSIRPVLAELIKLLGGYGIRPLPNDIPVSLVDRKTLAVKSLGSDKENTRGFTKSMARVQNGKITSFKHRIYILDGLPLTEFKGVLAHELFHVWLNENKVKMAGKETEGFCNLGIMLVNMNVKSEYAQVLQDQLEQNNDPVYGEGYRMMKKKLDDMGWANLLSWVRNQKGVN